jgi:hypothetical protein
MRCLISLILLCCLVSCGSHKTDTRPEKLPPDSIISRDRMIRILVDLHLVEATIQLQRNKGKDIRLMTQENYQWLFSRYHISRDRFTANLDYYKQDPENFGKMYEIVVKELTDRWKRSSGSKK